MRAPRPAVLGGQGLRRDAPPRSASVLPGAHPLPRDARRHRPQLRRSHRVPRSHRQAVRGRSTHRLRRGGDRAAAGSATSTASALRATPCRPSPCSTPSPSSVSTPCSAAPVATRSGPEPRNVSCRTATSSGNGIRRTSGPSCGGCTTPATTGASTCECSHCRTGRSSTSGGSSRRGMSNCPRCTTPRPRGVPS